MIPHMARVPSGGTCTHTHTHTHKHTHTHTHTQTHKHTHAHTHTHIHTHIHTHTHTHRYLQRQVATQVARFIVDSSARILKSTLHNNDFYIVNARPLTFENICQLSTGCKIHVDLTNLNGQPALDYAVERSGAGGEGGGETDNGSDAEMLFSKVFYIVAFRSTYTTGH